MGPGWKRVPNGWIRHAAFDGVPVTVKRFENSGGSHALVARGHVDDIQRGDGNDHVHVWNLDTGDLRLHDMRLTEAMFPGIRDDEKYRDQVIKADSRKERSEKLRAIDAAHASIIDEARALAASKVDRTTATKAKELDRRFRDIGRASPAHYVAFRALMDQIFESVRQQREERSREWVANKNQKERLVIQAESLVMSSDLKDATQRLRSLMDEWKRVGPCSKADNDQLWQRFQKARQTVRERQERQYTANRSAKERLVGELESLARSSDLKQASQRARAVMEEWKRIGPCGKAEDDRLWQRLKAARARIHQAQEEVRKRREADWLRNKMAKESLVAQMNGLAHSSDFRAAKDQARRLSDQWRATGPCDRADNDRLWAEFRAAKDRLYEAAKRDADRRQQEARQRAQDRVWRLEEQLRNIDSQLYRAQESYSRALSARSPSTRNPNWMTIVDKQQLRRSQARDRIASLEQRKDQIITRLMDARGKLSSF